MTSPDWRIKFYSRDLDIVENIIKSRSNLLNLSVDETITPLIDAIRSGDVRIVQLLISHGVEINHINPKVPHPLLTAIKIKSNSIVRLLIDNGVDTSFLPIPDLESCMIKTLLDSGIDVNIKDDKRRTFLYYAIRNKDFDSINILMKYRANVNIEDYNGDYPIHIATEYNLYDIVETLVENGAYINVENCRKETPLHHAVKYGDYKIVRFLLMNGCYRTAKCIRGLTPLHTAVIYNRLVIPLLINNNNINIQDVNGCTPLHYAVKYPCDQDVVDTLLYHGADIYIKNNEGKNVIDISVNYTKKSVIKSILANGVLKSEVGESQYDLMKNINVCDNEELLEFVNECRNEISEMRKYIIGCNKNILQLCLNTISINFTNNEQLNTLRSQYHRFPIYYMYISRYISDNIKNRNDNNFCSIRNI
ncbi:ankyrin repeat protein [Mudlarkpox virus]|nr:ankyrin repeat protein [Mudlarkpox virus]